jgi:hypothetical protein
MIRRLVFIFAVLLSALAARGQAFDNYSGPAPIILSHPINQNAPLNRGRIGWWVGVPGLSGSTAMYDVVGRNSMTTFGTAAVWKYAPLGFPSGGLTATSGNYAAYGTINSTLKLTALPISFACTVLYRAAGASVGFFGVSPDNANGPPYTSYRFENNGGTVAVQLDNGGSYTGVTVGSATSTFT